jgi:phosphoribosylformylglycinamidine (FGAM) synthase-like enzyme
VVTDTGNVVVREKELVVCEVPARLFTDECPTYIREAVEDPVVVSARSFDLSAIPDIDEGSVGRTALELLGSPNIGSRRPVYQRYDSTIMANTVVGPGPADAAVLRIKGQQTGVAISLDCNSRYCYLDPYLGAQLAVAEALRNVSCVGGRPMAITNCLNFRNPEKPAGCFQLSKTVAGMADACRALGVVVVSGNVSLYNETSETAVHPTPTIGCVGVLEDVRGHARMTWRQGDTILALGGSEPSLGGSEYLAVVHGLTAGSPPVLDLGEEADVQRLVRELIGTAVVTTAHDISLGGLAIAIAEMAIHSGVGARLNASIEGRRDNYWFGERSSAVVIAVEPAKVRRVMDAAAAVGVRVTVIGSAEENTVEFGHGDAIDLKAATIRYESALVAAGA